MRLPPLGLRLVYRARRVPRRRKPVTGRRVPALYGSASTAMTIFSGCGLPFHCQTNFASSDAIANEVTAFRLGSYRSTPTRFAVTRPGESGPPKGWLNSTLPRSPIRTSVWEAVRTVAVNARLRTVLSATFQFGAGG